MVQVLLALRTVGENMVAVVNNALKSFSEMQKLNSGNPNGEKVSFLLWQVKVHRVTIQDQIARKSWRA